MVGGGDDTHGPDRFHSLLFILHSDLHEEFVVEAISEIVTCIVKPVLISPDISTPIDGSFIVFQKRGSGKVIQTVCNATFFLTVAEGALHYKFQ
jgi:hypothetical protein